MYLNPGGTSAGVFTDVEPYTFANLGEDVKCVADADLDHDGDQVRAPPRRPQALLMSIL